MNILGMGIVELSVIFLVTFLVMGPGKSIEMAKTTGRLLRDFRRLVNEMAVSTDLNSAINSVPAKSDPAPPPTDPPGAVPQRPPEPPSPEERDERQ